MYASMKLIPVENIPVRREDGEIFSLFSPHIFEVNACLVLALNIMVAAALRDNLIQILYEKMTRKTFCACTFRC